MSCHDVQELSGGGWALLMSGCQLDTAEAMADSGQCCALPVCLKLWGRPLFVFVMFQDIAGECVI